MSVDGGAASLTASLALSCATGRAFRWTGYRHRSKPPGLRPFELERLQLFAALSGARTEELDLESSSFSFEPGAVSTEELRFELDGSQPMFPILRAALLPLGLRAGETTLRLSGSTHAPGGDTFEPTELTWRYFVRRLGLDIELELERGGFAPRGGGEVVARVRGRPELIPASFLEQDAIREIRILSGGAGVPTHVQQRQAARARSAIHVSGLEPTVQLVKIRSRSAGSTLAITGWFGEVPITFAGVSGHGTSAEAVGEMASSRLRQYARQHAVVPEMFVSSLLVFAAFASGPCSFSATKLPASTPSVAKLVRAFTDKPVSIAGKPGSPGVVSIASDELQS